MTDRTDDLERIFQVFLRFGTVEDIAALQQRVGTAQAVLRKLDQIDALLQAHEDGRAIWRFLGRVAVAFAAIVSVLATLKAVLPAGWLPW
jgi:hypothetical protein